MHAVAVKRDFIAQHYLIGGDWGAENLPHSHHFVVELTLEGQSLDRHQYLADIVDIERNLDQLTATYRDKMLNDLPAFRREGEALNPSIELFSAILCRQLNDRIKADNITALTVKLWENDIAWASYKIER